MKPNKFIYTQEMVDFIFKVKKNYNWRETTKIFNEKFNQNKGQDVLCKTFGKLFRIHSGDSSKIKCNELSNSRPENEDKWLIENYNKYSRTKLCEAYNKKFNKNLNYRSLENYCGKLIKLGLIERKNKPVDRFKFTDEMVNWVLENKSKYLCKDFVKQFNKKFNCNTSYSGIKKNLLSRKIRTSWMGIRSKMDSSNKHKYKIGDVFLYHNNNWIKVNNLPNNRITDSGQKNYKRYSNYVYEKHYNIKIPKDKFIIHLDGNPLNDNIKNLMLVSRSTFESIKRRKYLKEIKGLIEANALSKEIEIQLKELDFNN